MLLASEDTAGRARAHVRRATAVLTLWSLAVVVTAACDRDDGELHGAVAIAPLLTAEEATLAAPDGAPDDHFGWSVALSADGSRALVGALYDDTTRGQDTGSARVFARTGTTWVQEATLVASDGAGLAPGRDGDQFGAVVALSADGSLALIGAWNDDTAAGVSAGSARVFHRTGTTWAEEATLLAPDGATGDQLGYSVALTSDGSRALVGALYDDTAAGLNAGSARAFLRTGTTWAQEAVLVAPDGAVNDFFGASVALSSDGGRALVGAPEDDTADGANAGSVRVFLRSGTTWVEDATLRSPAGSANERFGSPIAVSSDASRALVGTRVFLRSGATWAHEATLPGGPSVALSSDGSRALFGRPNDTTPAGANAGSGRLFFRTGSTWAEEAILVATDGAAGDYLGYSVALSSDGSRVLVGALYDDTAGGTDAGSARVFTIALAALGSNCGVDAACVSGFCTDGVCCSTRCAGGANDCQACNLALTGGASGTCAALSAVAAPLVICRAPTDVCDAAEQCTSTSMACPPDVLATAATVCRAPTDLCDAAERCTGAAPACPPDVLSGAGAICRPPTGACDRAEACSGTSAACPSDLIAGASTICRPETGPCDSAEACDGVSPTCPGDIFEPAGNVCGVGMGDCATAGTCSGSSAACPSIGVRTSGTLCRAAVGPCDAADTCDGASPLCVDAFAADTTLCGSAPIDVCDAADHCAGTSAACVPTFLSGVECRTAGAVCDIAEVCSGTAAACPPDGLLSAGVVCRASTDTSCDQEETCDGISTPCPANVTTCALVDAGSRDASSGDAGDPRDAPSAGTDGGAVPAVVGSCACRSSPRPVPASALLVALFALGLSMRRTAAPTCSR